MKRTPISRSPFVTKRTRIKARSDKREAAYAGAQGRRAFVAEVLATRTQCEVCGPRCTGRAVDVHESITRRRGGAIVPGPLADTQGQRFFAICRVCHDWTHAHRPWAELHGFLDSRWDIPMEAAA